MTITKYMAMLLFVAFFGCRNSSKIEVPLMHNDLFVLEEVAVLPDSLQPRFPEWVKPGVTCYGLMNIIDSEGEGFPLSFPMHCKVISFHKNGVKCKVIKDLHPYESFGCQVIGVRKGTVWMEIEGDLFLTEEEAKKVAFNYPSAAKHPQDR